MNGPHAAWLSARAAGLGLALAGIASAAAAAAGPADPVAGSGEIADAALPRWEVGVAAGVGHVPDYPGAGQSRTRAIALPFVVYRGPVLRIDQQGVRGRFLDSPDWEFDLTASGAFDARDNRLREGMPALDYLFGVGPQWIYKRWQRRSGGPTLHLKLRALLSTDFAGVARHGFSVDPELRWRLTGVAGTPAALTLSLQPSWGSRDAAAYFYEVTPAQSTASRPAWRARAGYLGTAFGATLSQRVSRDWSWFATARAMSLHGAANAGSPLLADRAEVAVGIGVVWTPWRSRAVAAD